MIKNNVLIIDDEEDILNACKNVLEDELILPRAMMRL